MKIVVVGLGYVGLSNAVLWRSIMKLSALIFRKSVLMRSIIGLQPPTEGEIRVFGKSMTEGDPDAEIGVRNRWGVLFQGGALFKGEEGQFNRVATLGVPADADMPQRFVAKGGQLTHKPRILVLHGSLRERSFSRFLAFEVARILEGLGADVRCFDPSGLPVRDPSIDDHPKVVELRALSEWSEGHVWCSPEMHGCLTGAFKNQIDWLPLNTGSVRPTQGRTCVVLQVNGGSQSFNAVWKSTSELGYPEKYCVDLREPPRHRADAATGTTSRRWRGIATPSRRRSYGSTSRRWRGAPEI